MALSAVACLKPLAGFEEAFSNSFASFFSLPWDPYLRSVAVGWIVFTSRAAVELA
jgi:hypothetical protein